MTDSDAPRRDALPRPGNADASSGAASTHPSSGAALDVLRHFASRRGGALFEPRTVDLLDRAASSLGPGQAAEDRLDALSRVGQALGLPTTLVRVRPQEAVDVLLGGQDLVVPVPGESGWWLFSGHRGRRIQATRIVDGEATRRLVISSAGRLAALLEVEESGTLSWLSGDAPGLRREVVPADAYGPLLGPLQRLRAIMRPDRGDVLAVVIFAVAIGILTLATPIAVQAIVNSVALGGLLQQLVVVVFVLGAALLFAAGLVAVQTWIVELIQRRIFVRTLADVAARLPRVGVGAYDRGHGPELVNRIFDVVTLQKSAAKLLLDALGLVLSVMVGLSVLAFYHPLLLAFDVVLLATISLIVFGPLRRGTSTASAESDAKYEVAAWLEEIARNPKAFKAGGADQWVFERTDEVARHWLEARRRHFRVLFGQVSGALLMQVLASTALLGIGGLLVIQGSLTLGQLVAAELIVTAVVASVAKMGKHLETWYDVMAASKKVGQLLDVELEVGGTEVLSVASSRGVAASLELRGLGWRDDAGRSGFEGVDVEVPAGGRLAITGPPGSCKSVMLDLLWGLREPTSGVIRVDGTDIRDLSLESLRRDVALVSSVEIVAGTVRENVQLHRPFVGADDVRWALDAVGLAEAVDALPDGLDTPIHPSTRDLTEGELRRLMVARAIAAHPRILVVDGAFVDLGGPAAGGRLRTTLLDPAAGWTLLLVTDRDDVLSLCDDTLVLGGASVGAGAEVLA